jgi:FtsP/CotA-like multicopper oxidase with cupredoxin domain
LYLLSKYRTQLEKSETPVSLTPAFGAYFANSPQGTITPQNPPGALPQDTGTALQKFVNGLPGLTSANANNLGQYIPVADPDTTTFPGSDYYVIGIAQHQEQMHGNLPGTGYGSGTHVRGYEQLNNGTVLGGATDKTPHYMGPMIIAQTDRAVRFLAENLLPVGNLWLPVDVQTLMGNGPIPGYPGQNFAQNRAVIHLHGARSPWISDGTPHQWFTPTGTTYNVNRGVSYQNVPDMWFDVAGNVVPAGSVGASNDPGAGKGTLYYSNQQSSRLIFYHDHDFGATHYTVYAGLAAPYLLHDAPEDALIASGVIPNAATMNLPTTQGGVSVYNWGIPMVIQDKTFVPKNVATLTSGGDPAWNPAALGFPAGTGLYGDLWIPHIYESNQSFMSQTAGPADGRWDYAAWLPNGLAITPPMQLLPGEAADYSNPETYTTCTTPEAFMDTPVVNGTAYPAMQVEPRRYRFRILNACNERILNLQVYFAADGGGFGGLGGTGATATATINANGQVTAINVGAAGSGYTNPPGVFIQGGGGYGAAARAVVGTGGLAGQVVGYVVDSVGSGYTTAPSVVVGSSAEVTMRQAPGTSGINFNLIPDAANVGPQMIQIGSESGLLPAPVVWNDPNNVLGQNPSLNSIYCDYETNRLVPTFGNVLHTNLIVGPAVRTDFVVDFSACPPGTKLILYNDAPAPFPGVDQRWDYFPNGNDYTGGASDVGKNQTMATGGAAYVQPGYGPNTRTIMQFQVVPQTGTADTYNATSMLTALNTQLPTAYAASQPPFIIPKDTAHYGQVNNDWSTGLFARWKDINEGFDLWGLMNAALYVFNTKPTGETALGVPGIGSVGGYAAAPTEILQNNTPQVWKFVHNGVDTHFIHFHLFDVQVINRTDSAGAIVSGPYPDETGWKETIRVNPLETTWVALRPRLPVLPFAIPLSRRPLSPAFSWGAPGQGPPATGLMAGFDTTYDTNGMYNFGHEYVYHCHLLGHEDNDMMRAMIVSPPITEGALDLLLLQ